MKKPREKTLNTTKTLVEHKLKIINIKTKLSKNKEIHRKISHVHRYKINIKMLL